MVDLKQRNLLQGIIYLVGGIALLLYTLGLIETGINVILMVIAIVAILIGIVQSGLFDAAKGLLKK